jgi:hypothetical protein
MSTIRTIAQVLALLVAAPAAALAQDAPPPSPPPEPTPEVTPAPAPAPAPPVEDDSALAAKLAAAEAAEAATRPSPPPPRPPRPPSVREGFTMEVSLGVAGINVSSTMDDLLDENSGTFFAGRTAAVGVGGFVTPDIAAGVRVLVGSGAVVGIDDAVETRAATALVGVATQLWAHDRVFFAATAGLGLVFDNHLETEVDEGAGFEARVGIVAPLADGHGLIVSASASPIVLDEYRVTTYGIQVGWQGF